MRKQKNPLVKPFVKWAGGKRQLLSEIKSNLPKVPIKHFYEPFVGGGAVFLAMQYPHTTINDFNTELANTYEVVRDQVDELIMLLKQFKASDSSDFYYKIRGWDRDSTINTKSKLEKAARFIYLNKTEKYR